ncbi:MAG: hypothetical protein ACLP52_18965 [Streptosporangiaceae bacterium]
MKATRAAYQNMSTAGQSLGPPWLTGTAIRAVMAGTSTFNAVQNRQGLLAVLTFTIEVTAMAS